MSFENSVEVFPQHGELGCFTASAAFIDSVLTHKTIRPEEVDSFCERQPDDPMDAYRTQVWLLREGLSLDIYASEFFKTSIKPFLEDEIDLDTYLNAALEGEEDDTPEVRKLLGDWMSQDYKPSYISNKTTLDAYKADGKYHEHMSPLASPDLAVKILKSGKALLTFLSSAQNNGYTHAVALFQPQDAPKPYVYIPDVERHGGSVLRVATQDDMDDIDCSEEFTVVSV